jgi:hypothetical protein
MGNNTSGTEDLAVAAAVWALAELLVPADWWCHDHGDWVDVRCRCSGRCLIVPAYIAPSAA